MIPPMRILSILVGLLLLSGRANANDVFEVCKGESKTVVSGSGKFSVAVVYPSDFPVETTPAIVCADTPTAISISNRTL